MNSPVSGLVQPDFAQAMALSCPDPKELILEHHKESPNIREKKRLSIRMSGFNPKENAVWNEISMRYGQNIKQTELLSIAEVLSKNANIKLDRDARRRKSVLIKWFQENWVLILPYLNYIVLEDNSRAH